MIPAVPASPVIGTATTLGAKISGFFQKSCDIMQSSSRMYNTVAKSNCVATINVAPY